MGRGWTWIDENVDHEYDALKPVLDMLAREWSQLHDTEERFERQARIEDGDYDEPDFDTEEEAKAQRLMTDTREMLRRQGVEDQMRRLEGQMAAHGARIMRPYEHWNEDERLMEYMERER